MRYGIRMVGAAFGSNHAGASANAKTPTKQSESLIVEFGKKSVVVIDPDSNCFYMKAPFSGKEARSAMQAPRRCEVSLSWRMFTLAPINCDTMWHASTSKNPSTKRSAEGKVFHNFIQEMRQKTFGALKCRSSRRSPRLKPQSRLCGSSVCRQGLRCPQRGCFCQTLWQ